MGGEGRPGEGGGDAEEASEMHGPRKSTCIYAALTVATRYSRYIHM